MDLVSGQINKDVLEEIAELARQCSVMDIGDVDTSIRPPIIQQDYKGVLIDLCFIRSND